MRNPAIFLMVASGFLAGCAVQPDDVMTARPTRPRLVELGLRDTHPAAVEARPNAPLPAGIVIGEVTAGSPAERAGLRAGDVITSVDGVPAWPSGTNDPATVLGSFEKLLAGHGTASLVVHRYTMQIADRTGEDVVLLPHPREELDVTMELP